MYDNKQQPETNEDMKNGVSECHMSRCSNSRIVDSIYGTTFTTWTTGIDLLLEYNVKSK